jgi:hypothetical protein
MCDDQDVIVVDGFQRGKNIPILVLVGTDLLICGDQDQSDMDVFRLEGAICFTRNVLHVGVLADKQVFYPRLGDKMRNGDVGVSG